MWKSPPKGEVPAKIGAPKENDNNVETVRDRAKLYIRHQYETNMGLSIGEVTIDQRRHLAIKTPSGLDKYANNSELVLSRQIMNVVLISMMARFYAIYHRATLLIFQLGGANYKFKNTKILNFHFHLLAC